MTKEAKKEWLARYRDVVREMLRLENEKREWQSIAEKVTPTYSATPLASGVSSRIETATEHIAEIESKLEKQICERAKLRIKIGAAIHSVENARLRYLLERRYIDGQTWEQIAVDMDITFQWAHHLHRRALELIVVDTDNAI